MALPQHIPEPKVINPAPAPIPGTLKCTVSRQALLQGLQQVRPAINRRNTIPALLCVRISARPGGLRLWAADLNNSLGLEVTVPADVRECGEVAPIFHMLTALVRAAPNAPLELEGTRDALGVRLRWAEADYLIYGVAPDQVPTIPALSADSASITLNGSDMHRLLHETLHAAAKDETRPYLTGIRFQVQDGYLDVVATDSVRIASARAALAAASGSFPESIIPAPACSYLYHALNAKQPDTVELAASPTSRQVLIHTGHRLVTIRRLEGQYPDVMRLVPMKYDQVSALDRQSLLGVLRRQMVITRGGAVKFSLSELEVRVSSQAPETGMAMERVQGIHQGDPLEIGFNARYLIEALACLSSNTVMLETTTSRNPVRIRPVGNDGSVQVILPLITY